MATKTVAQKLETLVSRTMTQARGYNLYKYIQKDFGHIPDLADEIWSGYRAGDLSTRSMFHLTGTASRTTRYTLDDLIKLANATVQEFPSGDVEEPRVRYRIWSDVPGVCPATDGAMRRKIEAEPAFVEEVIASLDAFVEPARSAVVHTLTMLGHLQPEASDHAELLEREARKALLDASYVNLRPPDHSVWSDEQWCQMLLKVVLADEQVVIAHDRLALHLLSTCADDEVAPLLMKCHMFASEIESIVDAVVARGASMRTLVDAALVQLADADAGWDFTVFRKPAPGLYLSLIALELCRAAGEPPDEAILPALERFARAFCCNWFSRGFSPQGDGPGSRTAYMMRVHALLRLIPHARLEAILAADEVKWDTIAVLPSAEATARAVDYISRSGLTVDQEYDLWRATDAFKGLGEFAGPALLPLVGQGDARARVLVVQLLAANAHDASITPLAQALHDSSKQVRSDATQALRKMSPGQVKEAMKDILANGKKSARDAAQLVLGYL